MSAQIRSHLNELKTLALSHPRVHGVSVRREEVTGDRGYLRMRLVLQSQDIIEMFVYLVDRGNIDSDLLMPSRSPPKHCRCA